jgi:LytR cell envelope-related transcriptional attenuator
MGGQPRGGTGRPVIPARPARRRSRTGRILVAVAVAALGAAAVAAAVLLLSKGGSSQTANRSTVSGSLTSHRTGQTAAAAVKPSTVTVSVLNGTDVSGLAGRVLQRLATDGYRTGVHANASDQTLTSSVVAYMTAADRPDALAVATSLKLGPTAVRLIDPNTKLIACPPNQACVSAVVVTAGKDLAGQ